MRGNRRLYLLNKKDSETPIDTNLEQPAGEQEVLTAEAAKDVTEKPLEFKEIQIGPNTFQLFQDKAEDGSVFHYLSLHYGEQAQLIGGFLANERGDLIDMDGNILTSVADLEGILSDRNFNEFVTEDASPRGVLVKRIVGQEEVPAEQDAPLDAEEELEGDINAINFGCGCDQAPQFDSCCQETCCQDTQIETCHREEPEICEKPLYYDRVVPVPRYHEKIVPVEVVRREPVYIKKCVPVHVPVRVPVKVPVRVEVPCYQEYTKVIPVHRTEYKEVPQVIHRTQVVTEHVPKVTVVRVPVVQHRKVCVQQPYKVIDRINVVTSRMPLPPPPSAPCSVPKPACSSAGNY